MATTNVSRKADTLSRYMAEVNRFPLLTREEEKELALLLHETGDPLAANKLVTANLRFVVKVAYQYKHYGLKLTDLIQEGNLGLMRAVEKFDPHKDCRLISYAVWWIKAYIQAYIIRSWSLVKMGTTQAQRKLFYKLAETKRELEREGKRPTPANIAAKLELKVKAVREMDMRMAARDFRLDRKVTDEDGSTTHLELLADDQETQEDRYIDLQMREFLRHTWDRALEGLTEKEQFVVKHRLMADDAMTLQSIGDHFGVSRERIRQIEGNAKKKIRRFIDEESVELPAAA